MKIGFIGLGKMGLNMVKRLLLDKHQVFAYDINPDAVKEAIAAGAEGITDLKLFKEKLSFPRVIWVMVPAGDITRKTIIAVKDILDKGDILIDGGNSNYKSSMENAAILKEAGLNFMDCGTSGGVWGLKNGYCLMIGGDKRMFMVAEPIFKTLASKNGYQLMGPVGAGHFVKMIHNGVEYGLMQAYAEGFELLKNKTEFKLDLGKIANLWNQGSVVRSWLLELAEAAFQNENYIAKISGYISDSGEGRWTIEEALLQENAAPVITLALMERYRSRKKDSFANKVVAALRDQFGGHGYKEKG